MSNPELKQLGDFYDETGMLQVFFAREDYGLQGVNENG